MATQNFDWARELSVYMGNRLRHLNCTLHPTPRPPDWLQTPYLIEVEKAIRIIQQAFQRPYKTSWDVRDYVAELSVRQSGRNADLEAKLLARFLPIAAASPELGTPYMYQPCHISDQEGHILVWNLPKILTETRKSTLWNLTSQLCPKRKGGTWRDDAPDWNDEVYTADVLNETNLTGIVNLSPGWFAQGHETAKYSLKVSADMRDEANQAYLREIKFTTALLAGIHSIIQPDLFQSGLEAMDQLVVQTQDPYTGTALQLWQTPFTGLSVIINRETITHRDIKGFRASYDLLLTIGNYTQGRINFPGLGFSLEYDPGTLVALVGNVLQHGVCPVKGNRACLAHFFHKNVGERLGIKEPQWMTTDQYIAHYMQ